jgi:5-methylcytosine-specific restriction endonuclease McrA
MNAAVRAWYRAHREQRIAQVGAYQRANRESARARKKAWALANAEKVKAAKRAWQQANMATFVRASNARRRAVKLNAPTVPFEPGLLRQRWDYFGGKCWICKSDADAMDHVKPLSKGGWHVPANLRPVCTPCNTRKLNRWPLAV